MAFKRTYNEIRELILKTALDPDMARGIMRKAGLISGLGGGDDDGTIIGEQLLNPLPSDDEPQRPRRRVQNDLFWPYSGFAGVPPGDTYWDHGIVQSGIITYDETKYTVNLISTLEALGIGKLADPQIRWHGMHFPGFSDDRIGVGGHLAPHAVGTGIVIRTGFCWVGGESVYDPFPYPGYYLWADTREAFVIPFIGQFFAGNGDSPYDVGGGPIGPVTMKCFASNDGGVTWGAPWPPRTPTGGVSNPGSAYWALDLSTGFTPGPTDDGFVHPLPHTLKDEYRAEDVLFKFTLTTNPVNWFQFHILGLYILGYRPQD